MADNSPNHYPCPWCGVTATLEKFGVSSFATYAVACTNDDCEVRPYLRYKFKRKADAIAAWNRRAP